MQWPDNGRGAVRFPHISHMVGSDAVSEAVRNPRFWAESMIWRCSISPKTPRRLGGGPRADFYLPNLGFGDVRFPPKITHGCMLMSAGVGLACQGRGGECAPFPRSVQNPDAIPLERKSAGQSSTFPISSISPTPSFVRILPSVTTVSTPPSYLFYVFRLALHFPYPLYPPIFLAPPFPSFRIILFLSMVPYLLHFYNLCIFVFSAYPHFLHFAIFYFI